MAQVRELDQYLGLVTDREALSLKLAYITKTMKGEIPYSSYGNPVRMFSFTNPEVSSYIEGRLAANGIQATVNLTESGRMTVFDADVLYEGDL